MKKAIYFTISIMLCLTLFFCGCSKNETEVDNQGEFCHVLCLTDDGIIVWMEDIGHVYVKNVDTALNIEPLDTVVMEFTENDLKSASGQFIDYFGEEQNYSFIIENPKSIRHTTAEEPTFG